LTYYMLMGGSWLLRRPEYLCAVFRGRFPADLGDNDLGLRLLLNLQKGTTL